MYVEVIEQYEIWKVGKKIEITNDLFKSHGKHFKEISKANFDGIEEFDKKVKKVRNVNNQRTQPPMEGRRRGNRKGN